MGILDIDIVKGFMRMCNDGWLQGWHERNGGNLTYRMKEEEVAQCRLFFDPQPREWVNMGVQADNLAGEYFITTGSGKFFRNVEPDPVHSIGIVEINEKGDSWRIVWGLEDGAKAHIRVSQPLYEPQCPQGCHQWRKPRYLPLPRHQCDCPDLHSAPDRPGFHPCPVAERHRVSGGVPGGRGCLPVDGARRGRHCHGHQ